jgi:inhibitor of cysteine peptidase
MPKFALFLSFLLWGGAAVAAEALKLSPGASVPIELTENPSTGYSWRIDAVASVGLDHVVIADGGHRRGATMPGAPGVHRWTVRAASPGATTIVFAYQRPWEPAPVETRQVSILVRRGR